MRSVIFYARRNKMGKQQSLLKMLKCQKTFPKNVKNEPFKQLYSMMLKICRKLSNYLRLNFVESQYINIHKTYCE